MKDFFKFWLLEISLYLGLFCFLSFITFVLRHLTMCFVTSRRNRTFTHATYWTTLQWFQSTLQRCRLDVIWIRYGDLWGVQAKELNLDIRFLCTILCSWQRLCPWACQLVKEKLSGILVRITLNSKARTKNFLIAPELARVIEQAKQFPCTSSQIPTHHRTLSDCCEANVREQYRAVDH